MRFLDIALFDSLSYLQIGLNTDNLFQTYVCVGIGMLILSPASVNMLVCLGFSQQVKTCLCWQWAGALIMVSVSIGLVQSMGR